MVQFDNQIHTVAEQIFSFIVHQLAVGKSSEGDQQIEHCLIGLTKYEETASIE